MPDPPPDRSTRGRLARFVLDDDNWTMLWRLFTLVLIFGAVVLVVLIVLRGGITATNVADGNYMRGLITAMLLIITLVLVIIVVLTALYASDDEATTRRVSLARDTLAPLLGILGTIVGFYFGSQGGENPPRPPAKVEPAPKADAPPTVIPAPMPSPDTTPPGPAPKGT